MRRSNWAGLAAFGLLGLAACKPAPAADATLAVAARTPACGSDFELGDPRYPGLLAEKKKTLSTAPEKYPADAIALLDKDSACVARVERAPDAISLRIVDNAGGLTTAEWTAAAEAKAAADLKAGKIKRFYKFNVPRKFSCCNDPNYDARPDYDPSDDVNTSVVLRCEKAGASVACAST